MIRLLKMIGHCTLALGLACVTAVHAEPLLNFQFNEGSGNTTTDTVNGLVGVLGVAQDPAIDTVELIDASPSGAAGDRSITNSGSGFLIADASEAAGLNITAGPITMEGWIFIDPSTFAKPAEGILAYGGSYKLGMKGGYQVFTLFGKADITNNAAGPLPAGQWVHLAAAWDPGQGVNFYVDGTHSFEPNTNTTARAPLHDYLSLASEGLGNNSIAAFDRMRIHHALLTAEQIDSVAATPKATLPTTLVSYDFNQANLPATNSLSPALPAVLSHTVLPSITGPVWTNDTPTGGAGDFALAFLTENPPVKEVVTVNYGATPIDLSVNNTSYTLQTWVKLPTAPMEERRVILRTEGPAPRIALSIDVNRTLHTTILGTADFTTSVPVPNDNRWHHIAVVMENFDQLGFYLDGVLRQTLTRTQTGAPNSDTGAARLLIGKESETRYFRGTVDRVIIHNEALPEESLDFPAIPGVATFDEIAAHPANVTTDDGETAAFTATPTSATPITGQQWYFRNRNGEATGTPVANATSTTLTLENVSPEDQGFYYLVVTNGAGRSESYAGELILNSSFAPPTGGFELPVYTSGPIEGQDRWTTDRNGNVVRVLTDDEISNFLAASGLNLAQPVHGGDQALVVSGPGLSTTSIRRVIGLEDESNVTFEFWARPLTGANTGNLFITAEDAGGIRAAALRFGPSNSIDYGTTTNGVWQASGLTWDPSTWYRITMNIDYTAKTYAFLVNGTAVNTEPITFYDVRSASFNQIRIFRGTGQAGAIIDDLNVNGPGSVDEPTLSVNRQGDDLVISWSASATDFVLQGTDSLDTPNWTTVTHTTAGAENQAVVETNGTMRFFRLIKN